MRRIASFSASVILTIATTATAHDFWVEPTPFCVPPDTVVRVGLTVGERFNGDAVRRLNDKLDYFVMVGPDGRHDLAGRDGAHTSFARPKQAGTHVLAYRSRQSFLELPAERFENYLRHEGLDAIINQRRELGEVDVSGRELYSRCAKSLVQVGTDFEGHDRLIGMPLELVAENNPGRLAPEGALHLRLLFRSAPLSDARLTLRRRGDDGPPLTVRTGVDGRATVELPGAGQWLVTAVHMVRLEGQPAANWESLWASLTFEVASPAPADR